MNKKNNKILEKPRKIIEFLLWWIGAGVGEEEPAKNRH